MFRSEGKTPEELVKVGDEIEVKILRVDTADRKIGLSMKLDAEPVPMEAGEGGGDRQQPRELKGGMGGGSGPLFTMGQQENG